MEREHLNVVLLLVAARADVNQATNRGFTPLYRAAELGNEAIVQALLKAGANLNTVCNGKTAIAIAEEKGHPLQTILKLWQVYEEQKDRPLLSQLIAILKMPITNSWARTLTSFFYSSQEDLQIQKIIDRLMNLANETKDGTEPAQFKKLLESETLLISEAKYKFIMEVVFIPKAATELPNVRP